MEQPRAPLGLNFGLVGPCPAGSDVGFEVRGFFADPAWRLVEDPVTGSLNAAIAQTLFGQGLATGAYLAGQGQKVGADGRVHCRRADDGAVWIRGRVASIAEQAVLF